MATERALYTDRITEDPAVMVGKPVVRGTRISMELVLEEPFVVVTERCVRVRRTA